MLVSGGVIYTIGALVYAARSPDPWPQTFGYHEIFHAMVLIGAACHFALVALVVLPRS
jgi:hemolysin III